jgi:Uma2 family endonuclease
MENIIDKITDINQLDFSKSYSYVDYLTWKFQERVEIIKGKLFPMSPAPSREHQKISTALSALVWNHFRRHSCQVFEAPFDVRLNTTKANNESSVTVVQPDLCVICDENKLDDSGCNGAPDLIVEILLPGKSKRKMKEKFEVYEETGVREYWLVNPLDKAVMIYVLNKEGIFIGKQPVLEEDELISFIFPDLRIPLMEVFA